MKTRDMYRIFMRNITNRFLGIDNTILHVKAMVLRIYCNGKYGCSEELIIETLTIVLVRNKKKIENKILKL